MFSCNDLDVTPSQELLNLNGLEIPQNPHFSPHEKREKRAPGCLGYIGDYTTQWYEDYITPI